MAEGDLARHRDKADQTRAPRPPRPARSRSRSGIRLVHLDRVPGEQRRRNSRARSTRSAGAQRPRRASSRSPPRHGRRCWRRVRTRLPRRDRHPARGRDPRPPPQQQVERASSTSTRMPRAEQAVRQPASAISLQPGQDHDRADPDAREGDAQRQPAPAHEPVGQVQRLPGIGEAVDPAADQRAKRQVKLPRFADQRRQQQARRPSARRRSRRPAAGRANRSAGRPAG